MKASFEIKESNQDERFMKYDTLEKVARCKDAGYIRLINAILDRESASSFRPRTEEEQRQRTEALGYDADGNEN